MMRKHTPGPWKAELSPGRGVLSVVSETTWICGEIQNGTIPDEEGWANARLIAAATDLLDVLSECEAYFDNRADADCDQDGYIPNEEMKLLKLVRDALRKAGA
ncbi:hypothetical protein Q1M64_21445 [Sinorhizobium meliloti]|nr:hypothetical protein Q1M63_22975 [Sinorhizobium meliloti]WKL41887.1 hypothetical protein Q1M64_21445 [Sinorhizobium meliloti]